MDKMTIGTFKVTGHKPELRRDWLGKGQPVANEIGARVMTFGLRQFIAYQEHGVTLQEAEMLAMSVYQQTNDSDRIECEFIPESIKIERPRTAKTTRRLGQHGPNIDGGES